MQTQTRITFLGIASSEALEAAVREEAAALERYFNGITSCHVTVSEPHRHQHRGRLYRVKIHVGVPGTELVVGHGDGARHGHEDPYVAVRESFAVARRELEDYARRLRGDVKHHDEKPPGRTTRPVSPEGLQSA
jgi:ribosome-associated translation inhibitor RaiA